MSVLTAPRPPVAFPYRYDQLVAVTDSTPNDDVEVAFCNGTDSALRQAYDAHSRMVYTFCVRSLGPERAKDVTQEVFVSAWKSRHRYDPSKGRLGAWLMAIARNRIIDNVRSENRHADRRADEDTIDLSTADNVESTSDRLLVADALRQLADRPAQVVRLAYLEDLTHQEISERLEIPLGTVKSDIRRGLERIRHHLEVHHV